MFKKILVPVDGSDSSAEAARIGAALTGQNGGELTLLHVVRLIEYGSEETELHEAAVPKEAVDSGDALLKMIKEKIGVPQANLAVAAGHPAHTICAYADQGKYDLIIIGNRGLSGLPASLIGSVSQRVSEMAHCPVLLCRLPKGVEEEHKVIKSMPDEYVVYY